MGVVVGAVHLQLDQRVAIKFMAPLLSSNDGGVERFMREARLAAHIQCEHVARVFDVAALEDGTPYIVMEYLEGEDLGARLRRRGPFSLGDAVDAVLQASEAMAEAHVAGVVHRDLKPGNLFVCQRPDGSPLVKVLDFGISKVLRRGDRNDQPTLLTGPHVLMGSPLYCSPEQLRASTNVDARTDIWALGAILYELVSGTPPFRGTTLLEICTNVMHWRPPPLTASCPQVPRELDVVVARALAKSPDDRFATIADFARALAPFAPERTLLSVERIENVMRRSARPTEADHPSPVSGVAPSHAPCEKTLPSRPDASADGDSPQGAPRGAVRRWALPVAIVAVAAAVGAAAASSATSARSLPAPATRASTAVAIAASVAPPAPTASETPSPPAALAPLREAAPAPAETRRPASGRPSAPPVRPRDDTSQFGGLR
jgi:serine/threonine-protein kinase